MFCLSLVCFGVDLWLCINVNIYPASSFGTIYRVFVVHPSYFKRNIWDGSHSNPMEVWCGTDVVWLTFTFTDTTQHIPWLKHYQENLHYYKKFIESWISSLLYVLIAVWDPWKPSLLPLKNKNGATTKANASQCINMLNEVFIIVVVYRVPTDECN